MKMAASSWLEVDAESPFSLSNIPFGVISTTASKRKCPATVVGTSVINLQILAENGAFSELSSIQPEISVFYQETLNAFAALGRKCHQEVRLYLRNLLSEDSDYPSLFKENKLLREKAITKLSETQLHLPMQIGDYTDFYAGQNHAYNVGVLFRGPENALQPNYNHLPVGYHGRASSIVVSGTEVRRPLGQMLPKPGSTTPIYGPCQKLDIELELAAFVCKSNPQGKPIPIRESEEYIFGYVLMNDWSARDIQAWEYVPLGPFNSKNFATTISPWVVLADALEPFRIETLIQPSNSHSLLPYLRQANTKTAFDINLFVDLTSKDHSSRISSSNAGYLMYSFNQMLAHHTSTGCNMNVGDLLGSGTISGPTEESMGSLLEMTQNGKKPLQLQGGLQRRFLDDGDTVIITGVAGSSGSRVGFGECRGTILPAYASLDE